MSQIVSFFIFLTHEWYEDKVQYCVSSVLYFEWVHQVLLCLSSKQDCPFVISCNVFGEEIKRNWLRPLLYFSQGCVCVWKVNGSIHVVTFSPLLVANRCGSSYFWILIIKHFFVSFTCKNAALSVPTCGLCDSECNIIE